MSYAPRYTHKQLGWVTLAGCGVGLAIAVAVGARVLADLPRTSAVAAGVVLAVMALIAFALGAFSSLTVTVDDACLELRFGPGWIRKTFKLADIKSCRTVRNSPLLGWGIRWFPGGLLYNVSGLDAVELEMKNLKRYRIGTDEPQQLTSAIENKLNKTRS